MNGRYIDGWAFTDHSIGERRRRRYEEIKDCPKTIKILGSSVGYASTVYVGEVYNEELSDEDILILCDKGNTCFGGVVSRGKDSQGRVTFKAKVYTD
jgi:hypothetical protein